MRTAPFVLALAACSHAAPATPATTPAPPTAAIPTGPVPDLDPDGDGTFGPGGDGYDTKYDFSAETVGPLTFHLDPAGVVKALGEPASKSAPEEEAATGDWVSSWLYPAQGLSLWLKASSEQGPYHVGGIIMTAPCALKTSRGVGIGTSLDDVKRAYNTDITEGTADHVLIGSVYGGMQLELTGGAVSDIFIGVGAE
ncbi:MAG: hypothetical protein K8W52_42155 [Deltaproteobacteria bacterium]|nr:hypothetical protein [Deltaproteobacteria bacterium]